jgi:hypothetical protein
MFTTAAPLVGVTRKILAAGTKFGQMLTRQASWGVLSGFLAAATTDVEDIDGGPPGGASDRSGSSHH